MVNSPFPHPQPRAFLIRSQPGEREIPLRRALWRPRGTAGGGGRWRWRRCPVGVCICLIIAPSGVLGRCLPGARPRPGAAAFLRRAAGGRGLRGHGRWESVAQQETPPHRACGCGAEAGSGSAAVSPSCPRAAGDALAGPSAPPLERQSLQEGTGCQDPWGRGDHVARHPLPAREKELPSIGRACEALGEGPAAFGRMGRPGVEDLHTGACGLLAGDGGMVGGGWRDRGAGARLGWRASRCRLQEEFTCQREGDLG